jgi:serine phosphatase RsbU (regulator of sigma subunit)
MFTDAAKREFQSKGEDRNMNRHTTHLGLRYSSAVVAVLSAMMLCLALDPILEGHLYYLWFFLAVVFTGWYAGYPPCLVAFAMTVPVIYYFFVPPRYTLAIHGSGNQLGFCLYCFICIVVASYTSRLARAQRLLIRQQERQRAAREIQQALLPKGIPQIKGFEIRGMVVFAEDVGGDCFDYIPLTQEGEECLAVMIGDAVGHGMASALVIRQMLSCSQVLALIDSDLARILRLVNVRLARDIPSDVFVTAFLARLDTRTRSLCYANAGHCPGYLLGLEGEVKAVFSSSTLPLGINETSDFVMSDSFLMQPGELVVLVTDGIIEAASPKGQQFGVKRMLDTVRRHRQKPLDAILDSLFRAVTDFTRRSNPQDDMTVVLIKATD